MGSVAGSGLCARGKQCVWYLCEKKPAPLRKTKPDPDLICESCRRKIESEQEGGVAPGTKKPVQQVGGSVLEGSETDTCDACARPGGEQRAAKNLIGRRGDSLCESCIYLFGAASVLLADGIESEAIILPTLVFAARLPDLPGLAPVRDAFSEAAAGSSEEKRLISSFHNVFAPMEAEKVIDEILIVRREPFYVRLNLREKLGDPTEAVTIDVHSRSVKAEDLARKYDRALRNAGVPIDGFGRGAMSYRAYPGCLEILVRPSVPEMGGWEQMVARGHPRTEQLPFPPAPIVRALYEAAAKCYGHVLIGSQKRDPFKAENLISACVAWYIGGRGQLVKRTPKLGTGR